MAESPPAGQRWLSLGGAAALLGISESTVRRWADAGDLRSFRTAGGHRRVNEADIRHIVESGGVTPSRDTDRISDIALARIRRRLSRGRQTHQLSTFSELSQSARDRLRLMGRQMVDLFARHMASTAKGERFAEDARTIGHEYGRMLVAEHVRLTTAIATFNSLRRSLEETASQLASESGLSADEAVDAVERTLELADVVLEGMAEVYEGASIP